jgi:hypothetical protein
LPQGIFSHNTFRRVLNSLESSQGENALIHALELAYHGHGYGVGDF